LLVFWIPVHGQSILWSGKFQTRWESDTTGSASAAVLAGRIRGGAVLQHKGISLGMELQGGFGKTGDSPLAILHQAYIQWKPPDRLHTITRFGRFEMALGSERLLATNDWTWEGQAFTGNRTQTELGTWGLSEGFILFPDDSAGSVSRISTQRILEGISLQLRPRQHLFFRREISEFTLLREIDEHTGLRRYTGSGRFRWNVLGFSAEAEIGVQQGRLSGQRIQAYYESVNFSVRIRRLPWIKMIQYGEELYSGDQPQSELLEGFANPYGERHSYLGFLDRIGPFPDNRSGGIRERHVSLDFRINSRLEIKFRGHRWKPDSRGSSVVRQEWDSLLGYQWGSRMEWTWGLFQYQSAPGMTYERFIYTGINVRL